MTAKQAVIGSLKVVPAIRPVDDDEVPCECMLCDDPEGHEEMPVEWRLTWAFNRLPAVESGESTMLLCDHCLHDWLEHPDDFGGDPVRYHAV